MKREREFAELALLQRTGIFCDEEFCEAKKEDQGTDCGDRESGEDAEDEDEFGVVFGEGGEEESGNP